MVIRDNQGDRDVPNRMDIITWRNSGSVGKTLKISFKGIYRNPINPR